MSTKYPFYIKFAVALLIVIMFFYAIIQAKNFLYPIVLGVLFGYLVYPIANFFEKKGIPRIPASLIGVAFFVFIVGFALVSLYRQAGNFFDNFPVYKVKALSNIDSLEKYFEDQFGLADRGTGLELAGFLRALLEAHGGHAGGDGSGGDQHDLDAALMQAGDLIDDAADLDAVDLAVLAGEEAGTELDDPTFCHGFEGSTLAEGKRRCPASERRPQNEGGCRPTASQPFGARTRPCGVRTT